jgi:hypothetical protein
MNKITDKSGKKFMFNRVPYTLPFSLYIGARKTEDMLRIIEQILPYFDPALTIEIIDNTDFEINTKIPFTLDSSDFSVDYSGSFEDRRTQVWTLGFSAQIYMYRAVRDPDSIKRTHIDMQAENMHTFYNSIISEVDPISALKNEAHSINNYKIHEKRENMAYISYTGHSTQATL